MLDSRTTLILENTYSVTPGFIAPVSDHRKMRIALASSHARTVHIVLQNASEKRRKQQGMNLFDVPNFYIA